LSKPILPTVYGRFRAIAYENVINGDVHLAMVMGNVRTDDPVLVRVHTENVTCDMFGSLIDDTGFQLHTALEKIAARRAAWFLPAPARAQFGSGQPIAYLQRDAAKWNQ
jgi:GTP cyclohydrolase II